MPVFLLILLCFLHLPLFLPPAHAGTETLITVNTTGSDQQAPSVSGDWILWEDARAGSWDIYGYNLITGEERRITPPGAIAHDPAQSGDNVVWQDYRNGQYDIYLHNLVSGTETRITTGTAEHSAPAIDGNRIVWQDNRNGNYDIYLYDLSSLAETLVTPGAPGIDKKYPAVSGSLVVWEDYRTNAAVSDIFMNDTATNTVSNITPGLPDSAQKKPAISGTTVTWKDERTNTNGNIWINETSSSLMSRADNGPAYARKNRPVISGTRVVWLDNRDRPVYRFDVYMNDTSTGQNTRITTDDADIQAWMDENGYPMMGPSVSGNRIVWTDFRNGNRDIYLYTDGITTTCPVAGFTSSVQIGATPLAVQFTDTSAPASVSHWHWEFGDGNTSTEQNPSFTYNVPGTYQVRLTVDNPTCRNETPAGDSSNISVGTAPVAIFTATPLNGVAPLTVSFTDSSPGAMAWNWSFGDGSYSELQDPSHIFTSSGTYTVRLNASNTFGYSTAARTIGVLDSTHGQADTSIDGITIITLAGRQHLIYNTTILPGYTMTGPFLVCTDPALLSHGWQNITFGSNDGIGYVLSGTLIEGNISTVIFTTEETRLDTLSPETGGGGSLILSTTIPSYPVGASLRTVVWDGAIPRDRAVFDSIATRSNYLGVHDLAYTINVTRYGFPSGPARIRFTLNSSWVSRFTDGRNSIFLVRIADDNQTGEVMTAGYLSSDTSPDRDFFETASPRGFSTLGVSSLDGSGNPFQLITLSVTSHIDPPAPAVNPPAVPDSDSPSGSGAAGATGGGAGRMVVPVNTTLTTSTPTPGPTPDTGRSARVYTNTQGVVTQATRLVSTDGRATVILSEGITAKDAAGKPLAEITLRAVPLEALPAVPPGSVFKSDGMAYEIGPGGATFSPPASLSLMPLLPQWGRDYSVKSFNTKNDAWEDLPTTFEGSTGLVTAQFSHVSIHALFTLPPAVSPAAAAVPVPSTAALQQAKVQPPSTAVSVFTSMMLWVAGLVAENLVVVVAVVILAVAGVLVIQGRKPKWE
jgi:beta propeller repeat protein